MFHAQTRGSQLEGDGRPISMPPFCATGPAAAVGNTPYITNNGSRRSLAHEFGHILLNSGTHPADLLNLIATPAADSGEQLTADQCRTIFGNA